MAYILTAKFECDFQLSVTLQQLRFFLGLLDYKNWKIIANRFLVWGDAILPPNWPRRGSRKDDMFMCANSFLGNGGDLMYIFSNLLFTGFSFRKLFSTIKLDVILTTFKTGPADMKAGKGTIQ